MLDQPQSVKDRYFDHDDTETLKLMREKLRRSRDRLIKLGIGTEALNFNMVVFQQDTKYSHLYRAQKAFFSNRVGFESVESLHYASQHSRHFRITRLAELYERWVLVTLVRVLQTRFKLTLPTGWVSDFIRKVIRDEHNIRLEFTHPSWHYRIRLTYEYELPKQGTQRYAFRPDFVLELIDESRLEKRFPKLILDAKFRTVFNAADCRQLLEELAYRKDYLQEAQKTSDTPYIPPRGRSEFME